MFTIEKIVDHFSKHASPVEINAMEEQHTFEDGLSVLKAYARDHLCIGSHLFTQATRTSCANYTGPMRTRDDLWLLMLYRKDLGTAGPPPPPSTVSCKQSASLAPHHLSMASGAPPRPAFKSQRKSGFGDVRAGRGSLIDFPYDEKDAYFRNKAGGGKYKAELKDGTVKFVKFHFFKKFWSSLKQVGVAGFTVEWDINWDAAPNNYLFSRIFRERNSKMVDWAMGLMKSRDIKVSAASECAGYVPSRLSTSDSGVMYLSRPLNKRYLEGKRFKFDPKTKDLYWVPSHGPLYLKVVVNHGQYYNTFKRVHQEQIKHFHRLRNCKVWQLTWADRDELV